MKRKRAREIEVNEDKKPDIQVAGVAGAGATKLGVDKSNQAPNRPLYGPRATGKVNNDIKDRRSDIQAIPSLRAHAGSVNGPQPHQSHVPPAPEISTARRPIQITQDPLSVGPVYKHMRIRYGTCGFTEDTEPKVNAAAGPSYSAAPRQHVLGEDLYWNWNSERFKRNKLSPIESHQASQINLSTSPANDW